MDEQALLEEPNLHEPALYHADRDAYERIAWHYSEARVSQSDTDEATLDSVGD